MNRKLTEDENNLMTSCHPGIMGLGIAALVAFLAITRECSAQLPISEPPVVSAGSSPLEDAVGQAETGLDTTAVVGVFVSLEDRSHLLSLLGLAFLCGALMRYGRFFRSPGGLFALGVLTIILMGRENLPGYLISCGIVYSYMCILAWGTGVRRRGDPVRWRWSLLALAVLVATFLCRSRWPEGLRWQVGGFSWNPVYLDMWLVLRLAIVLWEFGAGRIERPSPLAFATWCMLPFTLFGPLLRFSEYERQLPWKKMDVPALDRRWCTEVAFWLMILGLGMVAELASLWLNNVPRWGRAAITFSTGPWSVYLISAGSSWLILKAGILGGLTLPVSMNRPFRSTNISDFWARWNISATNAFRDTLFYNRWGMRVANPYLNTMILFLTVGLWHSVNGYWALWGLMHGIGFCVFIAWKRMRGPGAAPMPRPVGWALTYLFVCSCWVAPSKVLLFLNRL